MSFMCKTKLHRDALKKAKRVRAFEFVRWLESPEAPDVGRFDPFFWIPENDNEPEVFRSLDALGALYQNFSGSVIVDGEQYINRIDEEPDFVYDWFEKETGISSHVVTMPNDNHICLKTRRFIVAEALRQYTYEEFDKARLGDS